MNDRDDRLAGMVIIVTGGAGGIGRGIATACGLAGARVVIADRNEEATVGTAAELGRLGMQIHPVRCDVTDEGDVGAMVDATVERYGRVDILVNNAGVIHVDEIAEMPLATWRQVFAVNVEGTFLATRAAVAVMRKQQPSPITTCRGKVINISSRAAERARPYLAAYGASKAAVNHLSRTTAEVFGPDLIATTVVYPGNVTDGMLTGALDRIAAYEGRTGQDLLTERLALDPGGRPQSPDEVGQAVVFVAAAKGLALNNRVFWTYPYVAAL